ncbi:hypothetical protein TNCV_1709661 [Trichonephila clavipes]|nr:hypothetical protein TNCV_1709661 [Trichonephila clavipes]
MIESCAIPEVICVPHLMPVEWVLQKWKHINTIYRFERVSVLFTRHYFTLPLRSARGLIADGRGKKQQPNHHKALTSINFTPPLNKSHPFCDQFPISPPERINFSIGPPTCNAPEGFQIRLQEVQ